MGACARSSRRCKLAFSNSSTVDTNSLQIAGSVLAELYERTYGESLDRNLSPPVRPEGRKSAEHISSNWRSWLRRRLAIYRVVAVTKSDGEPAANGYCQGLVKVQDNIWSFCAELLIHSEKNSNTIRTLPPLSHCRLPA